MNARRICVGIGPLMSLMLLGCSNFANPVMQPPVVVSVRDSLVNRGKVLIITNASGEHLHQVQVFVAANSAHGAPEKKAVVAESLEPHRQVQVGWLELGDRNLLVGDRGSVTCHEYSHAMTITIPATSAPREAAR